MSGVADPGERGAEARAAADAYFVANPAPLAWPVRASSTLTRETLQGAFDQLAVHRVPPADTPWVQAEIDLARWLDRQPPGTAEKLLRGAEERRA